MDFSASISKLNKSNTFSTCHPLFFQPRLTITQPNDLYEQQADAMAEQVMRMPDKTNNQNTFFKPATSLVQRKCDHCEEEEKNLQRKENAASENAVAPPIVNDVLNSSNGKNLDASTRSFFEPRFGYDFSGVRIHNDSSAAQSAQSINALAYTSGNNIVFNQNQYAPETDTGKRLLAHELTHVVQQKSGHVIQMQRGSGSQTQPIIAPRAPNTREAELIESARLSAFARLQTAYQLLAGIRPAGRDERTDRLRDITDRRFAQHLIQILLESDVDYNQVTDIVGEMRGRLTPGLNIMIAQHNDAECGNREGYVRGFSPPIILCPAFFSRTSSPEQRVRTLIHESAHLSRIGSATVNESYCTYFDCSSNCGGFQSADAWAHLVHCLSNQTPDQVPVITGNNPNRKQ